VTNVDDPIILTIFSHRPLLSDEELWGVVDIRQLITAFKNMMIQIQFIYSHSSKFRSTSSTPYHKVTTDIWIGITFLIMYNHYIALMVK